MNRILGVDICCFSARCSAIMIHPCMYFDNRMEDPCIHVDLQFFKTSPRYISENNNYLNLLVNIIFRIYWDTNIRMDCYKCNRCIYNSPCFECSNTEGNLEEKFFQLRENYIFLCHSSVKRKQFYFLLTFLSWKKYFVNFYFII